MQILFLSEPSYPRHPGGAGKSTHLLAAGLANRGHTVRILCESREETEIEMIDGVEVHRVRLFQPKKVSRKERENQFAQQFLSYIHRQIPIEALDILHDSGGFLSFFYLVSYQIRRSFGIPTVLHFRYLLGKHLVAPSKGGSLNPLSPSALWLEVIIDELTQAFPTRYSDALICPSKEDAEFVSRSYKPAGGYPQVIPDPVDLRLYPLNARLSVKKEFNLPGKPIMLFGGRIDSDLKGGDFLQPAFRNLYSTHPDLHLALLGKGDADFAPFQHEFGDRVLPIRWIRDSARLARLFRAVDIVATPSRYESFGMMCAEAMAAGTPVIASPVGGMANMVKHGHNGFLLTPGDTGKWANELSKYADTLLINPDLAREMGAAARLYAQKKLDLPVIARQVERVYARVIEHRARDPSRDIVPPRLNEADKKHYLDMLERLIGPEARPAGTALLADWHDTLRERCLGCTRKRMARNTLQMLAINRRFSIWRWFRSKPRREAIINRIVRETCPMGLIQKHHLLKLLHGDQDEG